VVSADDKVVVALSLSAGNENDAPEGRKLFTRKGFNESKVPLLMDKAYEGNETRQLAVELNYEPVVPPKSNRKEPWEYDKELYKRRNVVERLFRRLKEFRKVFTRYDKLDKVFLGFIYFSLSVIALN
jgi:transposase